MLCNCTYEDIYESPASIAAFALEIKKARHQQFCVLPFCHTLEAEALGASIILGDETAGTRPGKPVYESIEEVLSHSLSPYSTGRLNTMIKTSKLLINQGETIAFALSGPISTLSCLVDSRKVFTTWRKNEELMNKVFHHLLNESLVLAQSVIDAGVHAIEIADPAASVSIIGPRYAEKLYTNYTHPFILAIQKHFPDTTLMICPLLATKEMQTIPKVNLKIGCIKSKKKLPEGIQ